MNRWKIKPLSGENDIMPPGHEPLVRIEMGEQESPIIRLSVAQAIMEAHNREVENEEDYQEYLHFRA